MQINKDYEPEINLRDMFFHVLYRWRSILLFALIGAVLFGGYKYLSMKKAANQAQTVQHDSQVGKEQQELHQKIDEKAKQVEELEKYLNESVYINLSQHGLWKAGCKYLVKAELSVTGTQQGVPIDPADSILAYYSYPLAGVTEEELVEAFDTDKTEYVNELVNTEIKTDENTISVSVKGKTKESTQKGLTYIQRKILSITEELEKTNNFTLIKLGEDIVFAADNMLAGRQSGLKNALDQYRSELQQLRKSLETDTADGGMKQIRKATIKFALIGLFVGLLLSVCVYLFHYVLCGKLTSGKALSEQFNIPLFGELVKSSSIHNNRGFDKVISKWELAKNKQDKEKAYDNISSLIAGQQQTGRIQLVSTLNEDKLDPVKEALASRIEGATIEMKGDFPADGKAISETANSTGVILIEEKNNSENRNIERMAETLMINRANVIGAIVL